MTDLSPAWPVALVALAALIGAVALWIATERFWVAAVGGALVGAASVAAGGRWGMAAGVAAFVGAALVAVVAGLGSRGRNAPRRSGGGARGSAGGEDDGA